MNEKLKPCPFCGQPATESRSEGNEVRPQSFGVECKRCGFGFHEAGSSTWAVDKTQDQEAKEKSAEKWNRRATTKPANDVNWVALAEKYDMWIDFGNQCVTVRVNKPWYKTAFYGEWFKDKDISSAVAMLAEYVDAFKAAEAL